MIATRACVIIVVLGGVALAVVCVRAEQTRAAAGSLALERKCITLRRELWQLQSGVARLRTPSRLQASVEWFDVDIASVSFGERVSLALRSGQALPIN
jgi:hypothetical protein